MADQDTRKGRQAGSTAADAAQQGAQQFQAQMGNMAEMISRVAQDAARRDSENLQMMTRLAETMASGFHATTAEVSDWSRQAAERHTDAVRRLTQARSMDQVLEIQDGYVRDNLQALLDFSAKMSQLSAEKATEASGHVRKKGRR